MITLQTYRLEPHIAANATHERLNTEWLREAVNKLMRMERKSLEEAGADVTHFFNHSPKSKNPSIRYPLIIYHYIKGIFYITGINEGATSLSLLAKRFNTPFSINDLMFQGFELERSLVKFDLCSVSNPILYKMTEWLPVHHDFETAFSEKNMLEKVNELNKKLGIHLSGELGKYLGIDFVNLNAVITDITRVYPDPVIYKGYKYPAYDIRFTANVLLPEMITLGNIKALGFGRVEAL